MLKHLTVFFFFLFSFTACEFTKSKQVISQDVLRSDSRQQSSTRYFEMNIADLMDETGTLIYRWNAKDQDLKEVTDFPIIDQVVRFYEVSTIQNVGSWWILTVPSNRLIYTWYLLGFNRLEASGDIPKLVNGYPVSASLDLLFWIPSTDIESLETKSIKGTVDGTFPNFGTTL